MAPRSPRAPPDAPNVATENRRCMPCGSSVRSLHTREHRTGPPDRGSSINSNRRAPGQKTAEAPRRASTHELPADGCADSLLSCLDQPIVVAANLQRVLPHRGEVLVVAAKDCAVGTRQHVRVANLAVRIATQKRTAEPDAVSRRRVGQERRRGAVRRDRCTGQLLTNDAPVIKNSGSATASASAAAASATSRSHSERFAATSAIVNSNWAAATRTAGSYPLAERPWNGRANNVTLSPEPEPRECICHRTGRSLRAHRRRRRRPRRSALTIAKPEVRSRRNQRGGRSLLLGRPVSQHFRFATN